MKQCTKCKEYKDFSLFSRRSKAADGLTHYCKSCLKFGHKEWLAKNKEKMAEYKKAYNVANAEKVKATRKKYEEENKERIREDKKKKYIRTRDRCLAKVKENALKRKPEIEAYQAAYREKNRTRLNEAARAYQSKNWEAKKAYMRSYCRERRTKDPVFAVSLRLRARMGVFFRKSGFGKPEKTYHLIGCSFEFLVKHLEEQFLPGMTWANRAEWHIDHRIPLASAKTAEEAYKLFHYTNLQPLWAADNFAKGGHIAHEENA